MRGSMGGLKITIYVIIWVLFPFFTSVGADLYVFQVKESILQGFEKKHILFSHKMLFNVILGCKGAFVDVHKTFCSFDVL